MRSRARTGLVAGVGGAAVAATAWAAAERADRRAIARDPKRLPLFADFGGARSSVRAADGTALWARTFGPEDAPTIVMVHGWTCAAEFWKLQVAALEHERRIVAFDLRGHGQSERPPNGEYSIETFATDLDAVIEAAVPAGERALLVGHSLGAMAIVAWAGAHPERVDERVAAAVLVNTGVGDLLSESLLVEGVPDGLGNLQRRAGESLLRVRAPLPTSSGPISFRMIKRSALGPDASPAEVAFCEQLVLSCPADVRGSVGGTLSRLDLRQALGQLRAPTLVIAGAADRLTPPRHAREMAAVLPDVLDVIEIPQSGHMSPIESADEVNGLLAELAGCGSG